MAFRHLKPSWREYIRYVDLAARNGDEDMGKIIACYHALSSREKRTAMPEQLCALAGVKPCDLVASVAGQLWQSSASESSMVAAIMKPSVTEKIAQYAMDSSDNYKHAELFAKMTGSVPSGDGKSGNRTNIFVAGGHATAGPILQQNKVAETSTITRLLDMDEDVIGISKTLAPIDSKVVEIQSTRMIEGEIADADDDDSDTDD